MIRDFHYVILVFTLCLAGGCATQNAATGETQKGPVEQLALDATDVNPEIGVRMRFNPVECDCTPWEAWIGERWVRVSLSWEEEEMAEELASASDEASSYRMMGEVQDTPLLCTPSTLCLSMKITTWKRFEK
jgi:hypothetical protein